MCGICGYIGKKLIPQEKLWEMNNTMYHRGPNDGGIWEKQGDAQAIGMAQRRLSILDLSELGHQPMVTENDRYVIVYNGEVYNFLDLKTKLQEEGESFRSNCDTEVVLKAYVHWGNACFAMFNGMFAIAIYDCETKKLTLARDRIGKKPLYYYFEKEHFVFASELKPIIKYPDFHGKVNKEVLHRYLCNKYIESPYCIYENAYKLAPGKYLEYQNGNVEIFSYWNIWEIYQDKTQCMYHDYEESKRKLDEILHDAVIKRMVADVPIGMFLSGGIDSSLVTAIAQECSQSPIRTYSIGFYDKEQNEAEFATEIAKYLGTKHQERYVTEEDIFELVKDLPYYYDEPFSDPSQLPTMLVSKLAAHDNAVALSGDGGDELFCGYEMYDLFGTAQRLNWATSILYHIPGKALWEKSLPLNVRAFINNRDKRIKVQFPAQARLEWANRLLGNSEGNIILAAEEEMTVSNWQIRRMLLDMQTYLPDEILAKTDRASMRYSLEVRCPILDYRVIEESFRIPHQYKYANGDKKHILKDITYQYVPKDLLDRPKKGFSVPLQKWLRTVLKKEIQIYAEPHLLRKQDIFNPAAVADLIRMQEKSDKVMYSNMLWSFYVFQMWYQEYIEDLWG